MLIKYIRLGVSLIHIAICIKRSISNTRMLYLVKNFICNAEVNSIISISLSITRNDTDNNSVYFNKKESLRVRDIIKYILYLNTNSCILAYYESHIIKVHSKKDWPIVVFNSTEVLCRINKII